MHIASMQYGNAVSYSLNVPGHSKVGNASIDSDTQPLPVTTGLAWTPVSTTHVAFGPSSAIETTVTAAWSGQVQAASASQRGFAVYVPLVAR